MKHQYNLKIEHLPQDKLKFKESSEHIQQLRKNKIRFNNKLAKKLFAPSVDLRLNTNMPPVYNQEDIGSCTAQALCAAYSFLSPQFDGSRLFLYYNTRLRDYHNGDNDVTIDDGSSLTSSIKCLQTDGICPETEWPYDTNKYAIKPHDSCYISAINYRAVEIYNVRNNFVDMKSSLSSGIPFVVGIKIFSSFENNSVRKTGIVRMPKPRESYLGGHAVLVCGYNDQTNRWIVRNSWGTSWGDKGYFYLPYRYLINPNLSSDFWAIKTVS
jgi:C1A family cysteine protease